MDLDIPEEVLIDLIERDQADHPAWRYDRSGR
jgi:hypothetical protein